MLHLTQETIARLVDDAPNADEATHLASCHVCSEELGAMRQQTFALTNLGDSKPPPEVWDALEKRLEREGLIARAPVIPLPARRQRWQWHSAPARAAAAIVIFMLGGLGGAWVRGVRASGNTRTRAAAPRVALATQQIAPVPVIQVTTPENDAVEQQPQQQQQPVVPATSNDTRAAALHEVADVTQDVRTAEAAYLRALARYTEQRPSTSRMSDPVARLAALESILLTTKAALHEAPADPVINGYHLTALAERDAVLKQIAVQQSSDRRLVSNNNTWF